MPAIAISPHSDSVGMGLGGGRKPKHRPRGSTILEWVIEVRNAPVLASNTSTEPGVETYNLVSFGCNAISSIPKGKNPPEAIASGNEPPIEGPILPKLSYVKASTSESVRVYTTFPAWLMTEESPKEPVGPECLHSLVVVS